MVSQLAVRVIRLRGSLFVWRSSEVAACVLSQFARLR